MIKTATQLKAKVRNLSVGDSLKAQTLIRNYIMERFLERIVYSKYRNHFILKGGMLVSSVVGLDARTTMDIDTTVRSLDLSKENAIKIVDDIAAIELEDGVHFHIIKITDIMEDHDYPGIRFTLEASLDNLRQNIRVDISTGDIITPGAIEYSYKLMFEERTISLWTYNMETLMAEKLETIMARGITNTRMRDFYDIHVIMNQEPLDFDVLQQAFLAASKKRNTNAQIPSLKDIIQTVALDEKMKQQWNKYQENSFFVSDLPWDEIMTSVNELVDRII